MLTRDERERTAYHEAGHALVGMLSPGADPVRKVSIIPRGQALGVTLAGARRRPLQLRRGSTCGRKIRVALGGRAAEEVVYGDVTTGAESDIEQLTEIARQMVGRWGMSEAIGPIAVLPAEARAMLLPGAADASPETRSGWSTTRCGASSTRPSAEAAALLAEHRDQLESLTAALLDAETLDEDEAYAAAGLDRRALPAAG